MSLTDTSSPLPLLRARPADSHKGDYGKVLLVGGSRGMAGAISLAGMAALRSGAGLVTLAVPEACIDTVAAFEASYMTSALPSDPDGRLLVSSKDAIDELAETVDCIACGPGLGRSSQVTDLVNWMYQVIPSPILFDADALFGLAQSAGGLDEPAGPRILTPHPGEFRRFVGPEVAQRDELELHAARLAASHKIVVVLKGHSSMITDGLQSAHNNTGNPGMATGGSGDVLTGMIAALVAQGMTPFEAARLGCHVHGRAGDLAAAELGQVSMIASDLIRFLPSSFMELES